MQIALIGIGKIANYQMQAITHTPGIKLIDAHDLDPNKAEELPGSVNFHDNLEKMLHKIKGGCLSRIDADVLTFRSGHASYRIRPDCDCRKAPLHKSVGDGCPFDSGTYA